MSLGLEGVGHKDTVVAVPRPRSGSVPEALRLRLRVRSMLTAPTPLVLGPRELAGLQDQDLGVREEVGRPLVGPLLQAVGWGQVGGQPQKARRPTSDV